MAALLAEVAIGLTLLGASTALLAVGGAEDPPAHPPAPGVESAPEIASYRLFARLEPDTHVVHGEGTITWVNASDRPVDHLYVHLYMNAFAHERTVYRRERTGGFRGAPGGDPGSITVSKFFVRELGRDVWPADPRTPGDADDATDIHVPLGASVLPGEALHIEVAFETRLPSVSLRAGHAGSFHMVAQWFPKIAKLEKTGAFAHFPYERFSEFYADFGAYEVSIDTPEGFLVGATGAEVSSASADGRVTRTFVQRGVHDFAFAAWDGFEERTARAHGVDIRCLVPRGFGAAAGVQLDAAARGLAYFSEAFGAYPYGTLTIVHPPGEANEAGGMEYPTLITTGGPAWVGDVPVLLLEHLTLHELAHQWFYGLVATNENAHPFLDEGLTTWATGEALRELYGHTVTSLLPIAIEEWDRATRPMLAEAAPLSTRASGFATGGDYGGLVYARTATVLRTIDRVFDGAATRAVRSYARAHRFGHPGPADLEAALRAESAPAARLFAAAAFDQGWVDFEPAAFSNTGTDPPTALVTVRRRGTLVLPVEIDVVDADGGRTRVTWDGVGDFARIEAKLPARAVGLVVDPEGKVLLDESRTNDALGHVPAGLAARTWSLSSALAASWLTVTSP